MFYANAYTSWYTVHRDTCPHAKVRSSWWHGPFDTYMEACLPAVKTRTEVHRCPHPDCKPSPTSQEERWVKELAALVVGA